MNVKEAFVLAEKLTKGRWFVVFVSFLMMSFSGGTYIFGIYSEAIKTALSYDQETLTTLGFFKDLGGNIGILAGLVTEIAPPWVVLGIGALMNITGYSMIWLSVTQRLPTPKPWQMYLYLCIGANSQTFVNTGALVTCVKNFPHSRGVVIGILKGCMGLSGAMLTQIYHALYGHDTRAVIFLLGWLPSSVCLLVMLIVRPKKATAEKNELNRFYDFLYIALALAGFLMVLIIVQNRTQNFPRSGYQIVAAIVVLFLFSNVFVALKAEMDNMKCSEQRHVSHKVSINVKEDVQVRTEQPVEQRPSLSSRIGKVFRGPNRGEDFTIPQALTSVDMIILFVVLTCGVGTTLTAIDNMGQIGKALGYTPVNISTFVSLISIWNFLGRVAAGFLSEILLQNYRFPRPMMLTIFLLIACVGHVFIAFALPGSLYVASVVIGLSFGAQWPLLFAIISELFGLKYYATLHNFGGAASPLGSYLLSVRTAGVLYDREARKQHGIMQREALGIHAPAPAPIENSLSCVGHECFRLSFIIMTAVTLFGALVSGILVARTRKFYGSDIYAKFREGAELQEKAPETNRHS